MLQPEGREETILSHLPTPNVGQHIPARPHVRMIGVFAFIRHGARTPLTPRPQFVSDGREEVCTAEIQPPGSRIAFPRSSLFMSEEEEDTFWRSRVPRLEEIQIGQQSSPAVVEISGRIERDPSVLDKILNPPFRYQWPRGHLTRIGVIQSFRVGEALRQRYVDQFKLLPTVLNNELIYVRSTNFHRTIQTAQSALLALYPLEKRSEHSLSNSDVNKNDDSSNELMIRVRHYRDEVLIAPSAKVCPAFGVLDRIAVRTTNIPLQSNRDHAVMQLVNQNFAADPRTHRVSLTAVYDHLRCNFTHGLSLPDGFTFDDMVHIGRLNSRRWASWYLHNPHLQRLVSGRVFAELKDRALDMTRGASKHRLFLYFCHDSSIVPLLTGLGVWYDPVRDPVWPPYNSTVQLEFFVKISSQEEEIVPIDQLLREGNTENIFARILHDGKLLFPPGVDTLSEDGLFPLSVLLKQLDRFAVSPEEQNLLCVQEYSKE